MRLLHFILSHSVFIAICAVALCWQTSIVLQIPDNYWLYSFVFFSTLCSYNFYWLLSKYSFSSHEQLLVFGKKNLSYLLLFLFSSVGMMLTLINIANLAPFILVGVVFTILYSLPLWPFSFAKGLRRIGFIKTTLLALSWAYVTVIIPAADSLDPADSSVLLLLTARFFFMLMLCSIFDHRDMKMDKIHGLHSLATDVGNHSLKLIMLVAFLGYVVAGIFVRNFVADNYQLAAFCITAVIVWCVYKLSLRKQGYTFYYFIVDGLMLLSALLSFVATFFAN